MICDDWEEGRFRLATPDGDEVRLTSLLWYDGPVIFLLPYEGAERIFTCTGDSDTGMVYYGASPDPELMDKVRRNETPLIEAYRSGPFFRMEWENGDAYPTQILPVDAFPKAYLPDPGVFLVYTPKDESPQP